MPKKNEILQRIWRVAKSYEDMHFVYAGGEHGSRYVDYRPLESPEHSWILREASLYLFTQLLRNAPIDLNRPIVLLGPDVLGASIAMQVLYAPAAEFPHNVPRKMLSRVICRRNVNQNGFSLELPFENALAQGAQVLWFDDVLNAGSTFRSVRPLVEAYGAIFAGIGVITDCSGLSKEELGVPYIASLQQYTVRRFSPKAETCPLCQKHLPIVRKPGYGHEYQKTHPDYPGGYQNVYA